MSMDFTRDELEKAALLLVVDEAGGYRWSASDEHGPMSVAAQLRRMGNDLARQTIERTADPAIQAALLSGWEDDTKNGLEVLVGDVVASLRDRQVPFALLGKAFGVSRQAAWERFSHLLARRATVEEAAGA